MFNKELRKLIILNRIAKLEDKGDNETIIKKLKRELRRMGV
jgi:hypothetical protein